MKKINFSPETELKITAWALMFLLLALHGFLAFHLELEWFLRTVTPNFWVCLGLIVLLVVAGDRFVPMGFAAFKRGDNFIGVLLVIVGTGALIQGGLIIQDVSIQNTNRNVETTVAADSLYSQMVSDAQKDLAHYRELENKNDASFRSSKRLALQQIAYADSMRYARAKGAYAVSWQSRFVFITASLIFFVGNVYIFHLFSIAGSYKIKEKKEPKQSSENVSNLSPYLSRMNGTGNGAAKKSKTRKISGDAAGKLAKSEAFKDAIIELIRLKATGEYREGDGRPGTNDASSASELSRTYGLNRAESESLRRYSKKDAGYLENKFHAIVKKRTRASELQGMELQAKKSKNGKY